MKTLTIFVPTVGEPVTLETLKSIRKYTKQPFTLLVWYDACGRGVDWKFYRKVAKYTDDIILSTQNKGLPGLFGFALLYSKTEYIVIGGADIVVCDGWLDKLFLPFATMEKVALVGSTHLPTLPSEYMVNHPEYPPDSCLLISKEAINDVGGISPSFDTYAKEAPEFIGRLSSRGWNLVSCYGVMTHKNDFSHGREKLPNLQQIISKNCALYDKLSDLSFAGYDWWRTDL